MTEIIWRLAYKIWRGLQKNDFTFWIINEARKGGITFFIKRIIVSFRDRSLRKHPNADMERSIDFFSRNKKRISNMLSMLSDEKSKAVWEGVVAYRTKRIPLKSKLYSEKDQYFVKELMHLDPGEVFVDGGAYTGDTIQQLLALANKERKNIKRIIALEPNPANFRLLQKEYGEDSRIQLLQKGLSRQSGTLLFRENGNASRLTDDEMLATTKVEVVSIDDLPESNEITWIKMDIEGAEMDALEGAKRTILSNHPKLSICIYHSDEDMIRIVEWVHRIVPEYKLYIRHHSVSTNETVLYAIL